MLNSTIQTYKSITNKSDFNIDVCGGNGRDSVTDGWSPVTDGWSPATDGRGPATDGRGPSTDGHVLAMLPVNDHTQLPVREDHQSHNTIKSTPVHEAAR